MSERPPATAWSALWAVLVLPGLVGVVVPLLVGLADPWRGRLVWAGVAVLVGGIAIVTSTVRAFFSQGRGTLAPWDPPRSLVTTGLFARCRNPMYVGVITTVAGWATLLSSPLLAAYAVLIAIGFHVRVKLHEEPWAARTFPDTWPSYVQRVPRWLPGSARPPPKRWWTTRPRGGRTSGRPAVPARHSDGTPRRVSLNQTATSSLNSRRRRCACRPRALSAK